MTSPTRRTTVVEVASVTTVTTSAVIITTASCLGEGGWLDAAELARACQVDPGYIEQLLAEGLLEPAGGDPGRRFGGDELALVRRIRRLQAAFEASLPAVALMLDLLDENERLRSLSPTMLTDD